MAYTRAATTSDERPSMRTAVPEKSRRRNEGAVGRRKKESLAMAGSHSKLEKERRLSSRKAPTRPDEGCQRWMETPSGGAEDSGVSSLPASDSFIEGREGKRCTAGRRGTIFCRPIDFAPSIFLGQNRHLTSAVVRRRCSRGGTVPRARRRPITMHRTTFAGELYFRCFGKGKWETRVMEQQQKGEESCVYIVKGGPRLGKGG